MPHSAHPHAAGQTANLLPEPAGSAQPPGYAVHHHHDEPQSHRPGAARPVRLSVLGWSAWARVLAVLPVLLLLWLAVRWASAEVNPW